MALFGIWQWLSGNLSKMTFSNLQLLWYPYAFSRTYVVDIMTAPSPGGSARKDNAKHCVTAKLGVNSKILVPYVPSILRSCVLPFYFISFFESLTDLPL